jgi:hypothetical protein
VLDAVRRVEEAPLKDLVGVSVDDVEAQMDHLLDDDANKLCAGESVDESLPSLLAGDIDRLGEVPAHI